MGKDSPIEWTRHTKSIWWGCEEVSPGCDNCYARILDNRYHHNNPHWGLQRPRLEIKSFFTDVIAFQHAAKKANEVVNFFVNSMSDIFEKPMPVMDKDGNIKPYSTAYLRDRYFNEIVPATPNLLHLMLTKRPGNINKYIPESWKANPPANVMFGTSPVNQKTADILIPQLLKVNGRKFLSCEPLLGPIELLYPAINPPEMCCSGRECGCLGLPTNFPLIYGIDWVIVGGESGQKARPMYPAWVRRIKGQCEQLCIPFFFKQWGCWIPGRSDVNPVEKWAMVSKDGKIIPSETPADEFKAVAMRNVTKHEAGHLLDGKEYFNFPA